MFFLGSVVLASRIEIRMVLFCWDKVLFCIVFMLLIWNSVFNIWVQRFWILFLNIILNCFSLFNMGLYILGIMGIFMFLDLIWLFMISLMNMFRGNFISLAMVVLLEFVFFIIKVEISFFFLFFSLYLNLCCMIIMFLFLGLSFYFFMSRFFRISVGVVLVSFIFFLWKSFSQFSFCIILLLGFSFSRLVIWLCMDFDLF